MTRDIRNMPLYQSDASHNATLRELKRRVAEGTQLSAYDDTTRGSKNTECTLGLCHDSIEDIRDGVYSRDHHHCPHDARYFSEAGVPTGAGPRSMAASTPAVYSTAGCAVATSANALTPCN